jgi:hypothetical protein
MGEMRNAYNILAGKPGKRRPLGRSRLRREDNITMDLREMVWEGVDWIHKVVYVLNCFHIILYMYFSFIYFSVLCITVYRKS